MISTIFIYLKEKLQSDVSVPELWSISSQEQKFALITSALSTSICKIRWWRDREVNYARPG